MTAAPADDLFVSTLPERLRALGARVDRIVLHANRSVMLSLHRGVLRVHRGYAYAPDRVLAAIVRFLDPRAPRAVRRRAEREFLGFPVHEHVAPPPPRRHPADRPEHAATLARLRARHRELNAAHFGGLLRAVPIRLSARMRSRLGEVVLDRRTGRVVEIAIGLRHLRRDGWAEVEHTLLHEMVHQWQAESGLPVDHGAEFRRKAREVGIVPRARRMVAGGGGAVGSGGGRGRTGADAAESSRGREAFVCHPEVAKRPKGSGRVSFKLGCSGDPIASLRSR